MACSLDTTVSDEPILIALKDEKSKKALVQRRSAKRQSITKTLDKIADDLPTDAAEISFYKQKLSNLLSEISALDLQIEEYMLANSLWSDGEFLRQTEVAEQYADSVNLALVRLDSAFAQPVPAHNPGFSIPNRTDGLPKLKLP